MEEQVAVLRQLWANPYVTFKGNYHDFKEVGLGRPAAAPIPIWFGTETGETALRRVARLADGWLTIGDFLPHMPRLQQYLREAGRDTLGFPIRASLAAGAGGPAEWIENARRYQAAGVTHLTISGPPGLSSTETTRRVAEVRAVLADALD